jgi:hypothetical protein
MIVLSNSSTAKSEPPGVLSLVVNLEVVDAVCGHRLDDGHVVYQGLTSALAFGLFVVLDDLNN